MKKISVLLLFLSFYTTYADLRAQNAYSDKPVHTYSIVARDPDTGEMGVAVQSHWFSVGSIVSWAEAGVGAIATQSFVNVSFGPRGLELLKSGKTASEVLKILIESDEGRDVRQLAIIDAQGRTAAYTGARCIPDAGHIVGDHYSVQANMMINDTVWPAMSAAFEDSQGPLAERLLTALEAAQSSGGDIRGVQSAAILVVRGKSTGKIWEDRLVDLRVDDHQEPVKELRRLLTVLRAYEYMNQGDLALEKNDTKTALRLYGTAETMFPENLEMKFWHAISLANLGRVDEALPMFRDIFAKDPNWLILTKRLPQVKLLILESKDYDRIISIVDKK